MSRFDKLMDSVTKSKGRDSQGKNDDELTDSQDGNDKVVIEGKAKSSNSNYQRTTVYLPKDIHRKLKFAALDEEKDMSEIMTELIEAWLKKRES